MTQNSKWIDNDVEAAVALARQAEIEKNNKISAIAAITFIVLVILFGVSIALKDVLSGYLSLTGAVVFMVIMVYFRDYRTPHSWY